jgi:asparagine synthase (glutamine-hydrolysing)
VCGITGFFAHEQRIDAWFADATERASHRGPDGDGCWLAGWDHRRPLKDLRDGAHGSAAAALGFLRLAILDLSPTGDQPMVVPGKASLSFNGEIYNYIELRRELRSAGWSFRSSGDTEVLLKGWLHWGFDVLPRLNGMWGFALYDERRQGMLLCRDRFGEKPLFWTPWRGGVAFASEIKQLAAFPDVALRLDPARAAGYLTTGRPYDGASSWFDGIHQLDPGSWLWIDDRGRSGGRYFDLEQAVRDVDPAPSAAGWAERFRHGLEDSVRVRLRADVPVGTSLSAGVDSSAVMAEASGLGHRGYHSFTLSSTDPHVDESAEARAFAAAMGSTWHGVVADEEDFASAWERLTWHQECPVPSTSVYGQWKVLAEARANRVPVLLDGQGADEILGGYHKFYAALIWRALRAHSPRAVPLMIGFGRQLGGVRTLVADGHRYLVRLPGTPQPRRVLRQGPDVSDAGPGVRVDPLAMRIQDIVRWSLPNLLSYVDRNAMAHSIETRLPFLDPQLAALALAMPPEVLVRGGWTKWPLREALAARGGSEPAWRRGKRWFGAPQSAWLRGSLSPHVERWIRNPHPIWADLTDPVAIAGFQELWRSRRPAPARDEAMFQMLSLEKFLRVWFPT